MKRKAGKIGGSNVIEKGLDRTLIVCIQACEFAIQ